VLKKFEDVMPTELPKRLPPRREVDHAIELELGAKPPAFTPYRMAPPEFKELRRQLKELLDAGYIRPSKSLYGPLVLFRKKDDGHFDYASTIGYSTRLPSTTSIPSLTLMPCSINLEV